MGDGVKKSWENSNVVESTAPSEINDNDNIEIHNEGGNMADFNPPPLSVSTAPNKKEPTTYAVPPWHQQPMSNEHEQAMPTTTKDGPVGVEAFNNLPNKYIANIPQAGEFCKNNNSSILLVRVLTPLTIL